MDEKSELLQWYDDMVERRVRVEKEILERKILNEFYSQLQNVTPEYIYSAPTPMPLKFDVRFCGTEEDI